MAPAAADFRGRTERRRGEGRAAAAAEGKRASSQAESREEEGVAVFFLCQSCLGIGATRGGSQRCGYGQKRKLLRPAGLPLPLLALTRTIGGHHTATAHRWQATHSCHCQPGTHAGGCCSTKEEGRRKKKMTAGARALVRGRGVAVDRVPRAFKSIREYVVYICSWA